MKHCCSSDRSGRIIRVPGRCERRCFETALRDGPRPAHLEVYMRGSLLALICLLGSCAAGIEGEDDPRAGSGAFGVEPQGSGAHFYVNNAAWADIHYKVNGGGQLNVRMAVSANHNSY